ncbi:hypothetical protein, partial [uncultured Ruminococcus sp.]|uniref:hypothetical protein n=1 Tax=uncultured Ruminococcus sp. TaxID=165186 RepID=UPI0025CD4599
RQFNFLLLVKYLYFIFRITPTIDIEPLLYKRTLNEFYTSSVTCVTAFFCENGFPVITLFLTPTFDKEPHDKTKLSHSKSGTHEECRYAITFGYLII